MMVSWNCWICDSPVKGFEGEHGTYHGRCLTCGQGYGMCQTNEDSQYRWEQQQRPLFQAVATLGTKNLYYRPGRWVGYEDRERYANLPIGSVVTIYNCRTKQPVDRFHVTVFYGTRADPDDKTWLATHREAVA